MGVPNLAVRIHGKKDLRLDRFELPDPGESEILAEVQTNSICMSCHKASQLGPEHKRVPDDVAQRPTILGHEFAGVITDVGAKWKDKYKPGDKFAIQPAMMYKGSLDAPGYSFPTIGGNAQRIVIPSCVMETDCLLPYTGDSFFRASLAEPVSCVIGACRAQYHAPPGRWDHEMGIKSGGSIALLGGAGPMGQATLDYLLHGPVQPGLIFIADRNRDKLDHTKRLFPPPAAQTHDVRLKYAHMDCADPGFPATARVHTRDAGYDDVFVFAPAVEVLELGDALLGYDGCLNFFAGPTDPAFTARFNFYNVHYAQHHIVGTSGGTRDDLAEALQLLASGTINPAGMITHVGGIDTVVDTTLRLPEIDGGKKLVYTHIQMPMTPIAQLSEHAEQAKEPYASVFADLDEIVSRHDGLWNDEAERYLLSRDELRCDA